MPCCEWVSAPLKTFRWIPPMESRCQEQNPILNFAVLFLKILTPYMLQRAQFSSDFYAVFCIHQILILLTEYVPKSQKTYFTFGYNLG